MGCPDASQVTDEVRLVLYYKKCMFSNNVFYVYSSNLEKVGERPLQLSLVDEIEKDISDQEKGWSVYQRFAEGL